MSTSGLVDTKRAARLAKRRNWPEAFKRQVVAETLEPGSSVSAAARGGDEPGRGTRRADCAAALAPAARRIARTKTRGVHGSILGLIRLLLEHIRVSRSQHLKSGLEPAEPLLS